MKKWIVLGDDGRYRAAKTVEALQGRLMVSRLVIQFAAFWKDMDTVWPGIRPADIPDVIRGGLRAMGNGETMVAPCSVPVLDGRPTPSLLKPPYWSPYDDDLWWEGREPGR